jgi:hypothetical protein
METWCVFFPFPSPPLSPYSLLLPQDGSGYAITGYESLRSLYFGSISSITNQPKTATFTLATLKQALSEIITARQPSRVRTLDYMSDYDAGDHADHLTTARLANEVAGAYASNATLAGYMVRPAKIVWEDCADPRRLFPLHRVTPFRTLPLLSPPPTLSSRRRRMLSLSTAPGTLRSVSRGLPVLGRVVERLTGFRGAFSLFFVSFSDLPRPR